MYEELFEGRFLRETEEFYAAEGVRYMETADVPHFLQHVEERLQQVRAGSQDFGSLLDDGRQFTGREKRLLDDWEVLECVMLRPVRRLFLTLLANSCPRYMCRLSLTRGQSGAVKRWWLSHPNPQCSKPELPCFCQIPYQT